VEGRKGRGKRYDCLFISKRVISQTIQLTKDLLSGIPANALPVRWINNKQTLKYSYKTYTKNKEILL
jgi:hypothetical protein